MGTIIYNACRIARPSAHDYLRGVRATFNLSGVTTSDYCFADSAEQADLVAIANDWDAVRDDLDVAMEAVRR